MDLDYLHESVKMCHVSFVVFIVLKIKHPFQLSRLVVIRLALPHLVIPFLVFSM